METTKPQPFVVAQSALEAMVKHAEETYPEECCGVLLEDAQGRQTVVRCRNVQNELHAADPEKYPRDARTAYTIAPEDLLAVTRRADAEGARLAAFYHSHPDHAAYFSAEDRAQAVVEEWNEPLYPDSVYLVLSVRRGRFEAIKAFAWNERNQDYLEIPLRTKTEPQ